MIRNELPILRGEDLRAYMAEVRERTLDVLDAVELEGADDPLLADGFIYEMLIAHEHQHNETMLQLLQMIDGYQPARIDRSVIAEPVAPGPEMVEVPGGPYEIGTPAWGFAYDNERPRHTVELAAFEIDRIPVTNAEFAAFVADTRRRTADVLGARRRRLGEHRLRPPRCGSTPSSPWSTSAGTRPTRSPAWAGKRLPTEFEWEAAAIGADRERANLDGLGFGCAPAGAYADAPARSGAVQMLGDVWEWTASEFNGYPGFAPFPYPEYSQDFFGDSYKVLRGGSWATRREVIRTGFRNWDLPERSQIFSGLRCVRDP